MENWNVEKLLKMKEKEIKKQLEKDSWQQVNTRLERLTKILNKPLEPNTLATPEELRQKRIKLQQLQATLTQIKTDKLQKFEAEIKKQQESQKRTAIKQNLVDFRYAYGSSVEGFMKGIYTLDIPLWQKFTNGTEVEIETPNGQKRKVDIMEELNPAQVQTLLDRPLSPTYILVEDQGIFRKGKLQGVWYDGQDYETTKNDKFSFRTVLAVMRV